jgi:hypothetical protein
VGLNPKPSRFLAPIGHQRDPRVSDVRIDGEDLQEHMVPSPPRAARSSETPSLVVRAGRGGFSTRSREAREKPHGSYVTQQKGAHGKIHGHHRAGMQSLIKQEYDTLGKGWDWWVGLGQEHGRLHRVGILLCSHLLIKMSCLDK